MANLFWFGLDLGFLQTKGYAAETKFKYLSMIGEPSAFELKQFESPEDELEDLVVSFGGKTYYVGDKALETSNPSICTRTDKTNSDQEKAEYYAALGYLYNKTDMKEFGIITGLPIHDFKLAEQLVTNMKGHKKFLYHNEEVVANIKKVMVIPQSAGAYFSFVLDDNGKLIKERAYAAQGITVVIDIGYKTTDVIVMKNGNYQSKSSDTVEYGMRNIHMELKRKIYSEHDIKLELVEMDGVTRNRSIDKDGEEIAIDDLIHSSEEPIARAIIDEIGVYIPDMRRANTILCCGGTMELLYPYFEKQYCTHKRIQKLDNAEYSNAEGYYKYGKMMNGAKIKRKTKR